jgi:uncharacterized protein
MSGAPSPAPQEGTPQEPGPDRSPAPGEVFRVGAALYLILALAGLAWIGWRAGEIAPSLFVDPEAWWLDLGLGIAAAGLLLAAWEAVRTVSSQARDLERRLVEILGPLPREEAVGLALLSAIAEEVFFRGAVQLSWGYIAATVLFGLLHTGRGKPFLVWTASALAAGALLGALMLWRGNLLAPITAHALVNAVQLWRLGRMGNRGGAP